MFVGIISKLRMRRPLIHNITNYVTANDCANILIACGASPIMADDPCEAEDISGISNGICLNMGTLSKSRITSMLISGRTANKRGIPVILDPVGVGASKFRSEAAQRLLNEVSFTAIRGNYSEIRHLADGTSFQRGVDHVHDTSGDELEMAISLGKMMSQRTGAVIVITGSTDAVVYGQTAYCIKNGSPLMSRVTGTGCQLSALMTAFIAADRDEPLRSAAAAVCAMGLCGETAEGRMTDLDGNASFGKYLIDAVSRLDDEQLEKGAKYDIR